LALISPSAVISKIPIPEETKKNAGKENVTGKITA
jgi:hypothetical protein